MLRNLTARRILMALLPLVAVAALSPDAGPEAAIAIVSAIVVLPTLLTLDEAPSDALRSVVGHSFTFWISSVVAGIGAFVVMQLTMECACPAEVFTPGRGWHYNECFCGFENIVIFMALAAALVVMIAMNVCAIVVHPLRELARRLFSSGQLRRGLRKLATLIRAAGTAWWRRAAFSLPAGWVLLNTVTVAWETVPELAPMWGFPLPWAWWPPISSLQWELSIVAMLVDLLFYSGLVATALALAERHGWRPSRRYRLAATALVAVGALFYAATWGVATAVGLHSWTWFLPVEHIVDASVRAVTAYTTF